MIVNEARNNSTYVIRMLDQMKLGHTLRKILRLIRNKGYRYMHRERFD
jgi:hypothetical protein